MNQGDQDNEHKLVVGKPYVFCPWCGAKLIEAIIDSRTRKRCPDCDFVHYRNPIPAAGAIIENNGSILLVKRKYPPYVGDWCFPAGFMEYGESPERCCIRELKE
jgi:NADH pyrophosphatase NudC (nudix superfamily)